VAEVVQVLLRQGTALVAGWPETLHVQCGMRH